MENRYIKVDRLDVFPSHSSSRRPEGTPSSPASNWLLGCLDPTDRQRLASRMQLVPLRFNDVLYEVGAPLKYVYFPVKGSLSVLTMMAAGDGIEAACVGKEGAYGYSSAIEVKQSPYRAIVQAHGDAYRIDASALREELKSLPLLERLLDLHQALFLAAVSQAAACNGLHTVMQRCCRWLLASSDRLEASELPHTHEFLAQMLGVRRPSVTDVLQPLQQKEIIRHSRGKITIVDYPALEERSCECFRALKENRQRLIGQFEAEVKSDNAGNHESGSRATSLA